MCCLGVPIGNEHGDVIAGMSVSVHREQMTPEYREQLARLLTAAGEQLVPPHGPPALAASRPYDSWPPEPLLTARTAAASKNAS